MARSGVFAASLQIGSTNAVLPARLVSSPLPGRLALAAGNAVASGLTLSALVIAKPVDALWSARPAHDTFRRR